ncbi:hypothetical protein MLD38_038805 [Melastoma candidum]|uniref:Uncharacterized protein n=1 Tax=Melastoma candidum TaxID=119954 RepID=A0ACB9L128_9MYRT|nr:hypothetical protein MLD38_038805 [Melastoma candidum]
MINPVTEASCKCNITVAGLPGGDIQLFCDTVIFPKLHRFLFKQNTVKMIVDCCTRPVRVIQTEGLLQHLCLVGLTLRAPHGCHAQYMANMGSIASLAMAVIINGNDKVPLGVGI